MSNNLRPILDTRGWEEKILSTITMIIDYLNNLYDDCLKYTEAKPSNNYAYGLIIDEFFRFDTDPRTHKNIII